MCKLSGRFHSVRNSGTKLLSEIKRNGLLGTVRLEYLHVGPALNLVHFDRNYTRLVTKRAVAWVGSQPEYTVPLGKWNFRNFNPEYLLIGKRP